MCLVCARSGIYKMCTNPGAPQAETLFFRLRRLLATHVESVLDELHAIDGEPAFLRRYCSAFESFATGTNYISELFRYLVRDGPLRGCNSVGQLKLQRRAHAKASVCFCVCLCCHWCDRTAIGFRIRTVRRDMRLCRVCIR